MSNVSPSSIAQSQVEIRAPALIDLVLPNQLDPLFNIDNRGSFMQEIEVGIISLNGNKFHGTITPNVTKYSIIRDSLRFGDCSNFDGVRHSLFLPSAL